jgi:hypothetical protein
MIAYGLVIQAAGWTWKSFDQNAARQAVLNKAYPNIAPEILDQCSRLGIDFGQALFVVTQPVIEQSTSVSDPASADYRLYNMQVHDEEIATFSAADLDAMTKRKIQVPGIPGVSVRKISSLEHLKGKMESRVSPFFVFDSVSHSVNHFLRRLSGDPKYFLTLKGNMLSLQSCYSKAFAVLLDPKSGIDDYTTALKKCAYASGPDYAHDMHNRYRTVCDDFIHMIDANRAAVTKAAAAVTDPPIDYGSILDAMKAVATDQLKKTPLLP